MAAFPPGLDTSFAALARQGAAFDDPDSPSDRYYAFLAEIEPISPTKTDPLRWSVQFELVPFEWMEAAVLSQPDTVRTPPPAAPLSLLAFEPAEPKIVAEALGTTPDDVAEGDWFVVTLGKGIPAGRVRVPAMAPILPVKATAIKLPRGTRLTKLRRRYKPAGRFSAKALAAMLAALQPREVGVMDVGQASCTLVYDNAGAALLYVDVGLPMFFNNASRPPANAAGTIGIVAPGPCLQDDPPVVVTHWHWDHYTMAVQSANAAAICDRPWIVSGQPAGPWAAAVIAAVNASPNGIAHVFPAGLPLFAAGLVTVIQCVPGPGVAADLNNTGIAVVVRLADAAGYRVLLPGDAAFQSIPGLAAVAGLKWMPATHHGSDTNLIPAGGAASPIPAPYAANQGRLAYSYGINGAPGIGAHCYGHPDAPAVAAYPAAGWGTAPLVQSTAETGPNSGVAGRGNIMMANNVPPPPCPTPNCPFHAFPKLLV